MQHGSRSHSSRLVPSFSAPLLFVTTLVVFLLTVWLATTNQSQQNLFHLYHRQQKQEQRQKAGKRSCVPHSIVKLEQKNDSMNKRQQEDEIGKIHWQPSYLHLYLQLLKKINGGEYKGDENLKRNLCTAGEETHYENIKNEANSFTTILCILLLLEVKRRAVEISCKSNPKKPQARSCLDGFTAEKASMIKSSLLNVGYRRFARSCVNTAVGNYSECQLKNNVYEHCYPRQVVNVRETESETKLHTTVAAAAPADDMGKVDQNHHQQNRIHASLASYYGKDIEVKRIALLMMVKRRHRTDIGKKGIHFPGKWDPTINATPLQPELCGNSKRRNIKISLKPKGKVVAESRAIEFLVKQVAEQISNPGSTLINAVVASGVTGSKNKMGLLTTKILVSSPSLSSASYVFPACAMTSPQLSKRFITTARFITNKPTLTSYSPPRGKEKDFKVHILVKSPLVFFIVVARESAAIVTSVQVIVLFVVTRIIRKEVDSSIHHHHRHHFSVLFPSACSYYNSQTTSGLSSFPFLSPSSLPVLTPRILPTTSNPTATTTGATTTTAATTMNTSTTSFQPLFCLRNKAEEEGCLPRLEEEKRLLQKATPPPSSPLEYFTVTVPTTNINAGKFASTVFGQNLSSFHSAQTVAR